MFQFFLLWLVLLLPLSGGTSKGHLVEREAKVTPPHEVTFYFLEARCVSSKDKMETMLAILALYYADSANFCNSMHQLPHKCHRSGDLVRVTLSTMVTMAVKQLKYNNLAGKNKSRL